MYFHSMGMIKASTKSAAVTDNYLSLEIPRRRLKPADKAIILKTGDISIRHCQDPKKTGINSIKLKPIHELMDDFLLPLQSFKSESLRHTMVSRLDYQGKG